MFVTKDLKKAETENQVFCFGQKFFGNKAKALAAKAIIEKIENFLHKKYFNLK